MYQQLIWEMFDHVQAGWSASGDTDTAFLSSVKNASGVVDNGIHIGSWGQLQGWWNILSLFKQNYSAYSLFRMEDR